MYEHRYDFEAKLAQNAGIIILSNTLTVPSTKPARKHRKKRIAKKWLKRYGYRKEPDPNIYFVEGGRILMHPFIFKKFKNSLGLSTNEETAEAIIKAMNS